MLEVTRFDFALAQLRVNPAKVKSSSSSLSSRRWRARVGGRSAGTVFFICINEEGGAGNDGI